MTAIARNVSQSELKRGYERLQGLRARLEKVKEHAAKTTEKVVRTVEVGASALGFGMVQGRLGSVEVMGVPVDLGAGVALNLLGYFGAAGKYSDHLNNFGDGALASYLNTVGKGIGAAMAVKAGKLPAGGAGQINAPAKGVSLSPEEIAAAVAR